MKRRYDAEYFVIVRGKDAVAAKSNGHASNGQAGQNGSCKKKRRKPATNRLSRHRVCSSR